MVSRFLTFRLELTGSTVFFLFYLILFFIDLVSALHRFFNRIEVVSGLSIVCIIMILFLQKNVRGYEVESRLRYSLDLKAKSCYSADTHTSLIYHDVTYWFVDDHFEAWSLAS